MKTLQQFYEEISPRRMAELEAKGKGNVARAKAKADGIDVPKKENMRRVQQGNVNINKKETEAKKPAGPSKPLNTSGGALVKTDKTQTVIDNHKKNSSALAKSSGGKMVKSPGGSLSKTSDKGSSLVSMNKGRTSKEATGKTNVPNPSISKGYMTSPDKQRTPSKVETKKEFQKRDKKDKMKKKLSNMASNAARQTLSKAKRSLEDLSKDNNPTSKGEAQASGKQVSYAGGSRS